MPKMEAMHKKRSMENLFAEKPEKQRMKMSTAMIRKPIIGRYMYRSAMVALGIGKMLLMGMELRINHAMPRLVFQLR